MTQATALSFNQCPKCATPIRDDNVLTWCRQCSQTFPPEIKDIIVARNQKVEAALAGAARSQVEAPLILAPLPAGIITSASNPVVLLIHRYKAAYLAAKLISGLDRPLKRMGLAAAILLSLGGLVAVLSGQPGELAFALGLMAIVFGLFVGVLFYVLGLIVFSQGEILRASIDSALNSSPFLSDEDRTRILFLPE